MPYSCRGLILSIDDFYFLFYRFEMAWLPLVYAVIFPNIGGIINAIMIKNAVRDWYDKVGDVVNSWMYLQTDSFI